METFGFQPRPLANKVLVSGRKWAVECFAQGKRINEVVFVWCRPETELG